VFVLFGRTAPAGAFTVVLALLGLGLLLAFSWLVIRRIGLLGQMLAGYALAPIAGVYLLSLLFPNNYDLRDTILALPACLAILALGWTALPRRLPAVRLLPLACLAFLVPTGWSLARNYADTSVARDDYRGAFELVRQQALPGDVLVYESPVQVTAVDYYFQHPPIAAASVPLGASDAAIASQLTELEQRYEGIWLMEALDRRHTVEQWLDVFATPVSNQWFGGGLRLKHYLPPSKPLAQASLPAGQAVHRDFGPLRLEQLSTSGSLAGRSLAVELLWSTPQRPAADLTSSLQLFGPDGSRLAQLDAPPLRGAVPTSRWQPGYGYADELRLPPLAAAPPGLYQLKLAVYDQQQRVVAPLTTIAVLPVAGGWQELAAKDSADAGWTIDSVELGNAANGDLIVQAQAVVDQRPPTRYTWFAHLLDAQGKLLSQDDHPPLAASLEPGDHLVEEFALAGAVQPGDVLELGAYDSSGRRVAFSGQSSRGDHLLLPLPAARQ